MTLIDPKIKRKPLKKSSLLAPYRELITTGIFYVIKNSLHSNSELFKTFINIFLY